MEREARLEPLPQIVARLRFGKRCIDHGPLARKLRAILEAPVGICLGHRPAHRVLADILEQAAPDYLADLSFVIDDEILGDAADHLGETVLPDLVPIAHLDLAAGKADYCRASAGAGHRYRKVVDERLKRIRLVAITV